MRITDLLDPRSISLTATPKTKSEALDQLVDLMCASGKINDKEAYRKQVYAREEESTTGIGLGIGIPHGKCDAVDKPGLAAMVVKNGVDFEALDDAPVTLLFLIAAPNTEDNVHLSVLSKLSVMKLLIRPMMKRRVLMKDWQTQVKQKKIQQKFWQLHHVLQELPTHTWQQKVLKQQLRLRDAL